MAVSAQAGCAGGRTPEAGDPRAVSDAPGWVNLHPGSFKGETGRIFRAVGISSDARGGTFRRQDADAKARAEIAAGVTAYIEQLARLSASGGVNRTAAEEHDASDALRTLTQMQLSAVSIVEHFLTDDGTEYSLAEVDIEGLARAMPRMVKELIERTRNPPPERRVFDETGTNGAER